MSPIEALPILPFVTPDLPGIGGQLRATPEHFVVEELSLYEPQDDGPHLYVNLTKRGLTTKEVQAQLERLFGLPRGEVGFAGLKDKAALTTQTFSILVNNHKTGQEAEMVERIHDAMPVTVNWARWHRNKLKTGHLLGNRFTVTVTDLALPGEAALAAAEVIAARLRAIGLPNYFGPQRFGQFGDNAQRGLELLLGRRSVHDRWLRQFLISAYQSFLCNRYLAQRVELDAFTRLLPGDIAKKHATGGIFAVEDLSAEQARFEAQEISFTAPLYGSKMRSATLAAGDLENAILAETGLTDAHWRAARIEGTRRLGRVLLPELRLSLQQGTLNETLHETLTVEFALPKGSFATTVLAEFIKGESSALPEDSDDE